MLDSWIAFDAAIKLAENALTTNKVESFANLLSLVHKNFFDFDREFRNFKADVIEMATWGKATHDFLVHEQIGEVASNVQCNDAWQTFKCLDILIPWKN